MDNIEIIILIVAVIAYSLLTSRKKLKEQKSVSDEIPDNEEKNIPVYPSKTENQNSKKRVSFEEIKTNPSKIGNYFTYEEINKSEEDYYDKSGFNGSKKVQNIENEEEYTPLIQIEQNEVIKGVIWGEILKNPYN